MSRPPHKIATPAAWTAARLALLEAEKEMTRQADRLAAQRRELPWVTIEKDYTFDSAQGPVGWRICSPATVN